MRVLEVTSSLLTGTTAPMDIYYTLGSKPLHEKLIAKLGSDGSGMVAEGIFMLGELLEVHWYPI